VRSRALAGFAVGVFGAVAGVLLLYSQMGPEAGGSDSGGQDAPVAENRPQVSPIPNVVEIAGYTPEPGCFIDRLAERDGQVWSEGLAKALRPIEDPASDVRVFPVSALGVVINCAMASNEASSESTPAPCVPGQAGVGPDGWVHLPSGESRPNLPIVIELQAVEAGVVETGEVNDDSVRRFYQVAMPLSADSVVVGECFPAP
jgi:hypothetical protein